MNCPLSARRTKFEPERLTKNASHISCQVALAFSLRCRLERGEFDDLATMSRALGLTWARITQLMNLLLSAPEILEEILFLDVPAHAQPVSERSRREALCRAADWREERRAWEGLKEQGSPQSVA